MLISYLPIRIDQGSLEKKLASSSLCEKDLEAWKNNILNFLDEYKVIVESVQKSYRENLNLDLLKVLNRGLFTGKKFTKIFCTHLEFIFKYFLFRKEKLLIF